MRKNFEASSQPGWPPTSCPPSLTFEMNLCRGLQPASYSRPACVRILSIVGHDARRFTHRCHDGQTTHQYGPEESRRAVSRLPHVSAVTGGGVTRVRRNLGDARSEHVRSRTLTWYSGQ